MFKVNLKNYVVIIFLLIVLIGGVYHFNDICNFLTITFKL